MAQQQPLHTRMMFLASVRSRANATHNMAFIIARSRVMADSMHRLHQQERSENASEEMAMQGPETCLAAKRVAGDGFVRQY
jgi:hypothetical protein